VRLGILRSAPLVRANVGALALLVAGIDAILAPTVTPWFVRRFGNVGVIFAGMLLGVAAYATFLRVGEDWAYGLLVPGLVLIGLAFALTYGPLTIAATDGVAEAEQGLAGGLLNASVQFGGALMLAVVTAVNVVVTGDDPSRAALLDGYRAALVVPLVAVVVGAVITAAGLRRPGGATVAVEGTAPPQPSAPPTPPTGAEAA
jgi:hypothetical protein